jgi:riboflavin synthase
MFTGIIEEIGVIKAVRKQNRSLGLTISARKVTTDLKVGDSINTEGVCLTVTSFSSVEFVVDVMPETYDKSGLSKLVSGDKVNLERALRLDDRFGGHIVSGHIDGVGKISRTWKDENAVWFTVTADPGILRYIVEKGSVALDGISLTVARVDGNSFNVSIIPHTQHETTLLSKKPGSLLNVECDILGKYIEKLLYKGNDKISLDFLQKMDF